MYPNYANNQLMRFFVYNAANITRLYPLDCMASVDIWAGGHTADIGGVQCEGSTCYQRERGAYQEDERGDGSVYVPSLLFSLYDLPVSKRKTKLFMYCIRYDASCGTICVRIVIVEFNMLFTHTFCLSIQ